MIMIKLQNCLTTFECNGYAASVIRISVTAENLTNYEVSLLIMFTS